MFGLNPHDKSKRPHYLRAQTTSGSEDQPQSEFLYPDKKDVVPEEVRSLPRTPVYSLKNHGFEYRRSTVKCKQDIAITG